LLLLTYENDRVEIKINTNDSEEFYDYVEFFKSIFISYDSKKKTSFFKIDRFYEIQEWFKRKNYAVQCSELVLLKYAEFAKSFTPEIKYNRKASINYSILNPNIELYEFQKQGIEFLLGKSRAYLADDAGLGKTVQAIATFAQLYKEEKIDGIFIVVKTGLSYQWKKSILEFVSVFKEDDIIIIDNSNKLKLFEKYKDKKIIIVPCHLIAHIFLSYKEGHKLKESAKKIRWKSFIDINKVWKENLMLVIDEAHTFNNSSWSN